MCRFHNHSSNNDQPLWHLSEKMSELIDYYAFKTLFCQSFMGNYIFFLVKSLIKWFCFCRDATFCVSKLMISKNKMQHFVSLQLSGATIGLCHLSSVICLSWFHHKKNQIHPFFFKLVMIYYLYSSSYKIYKWVDGTSE